jgi:hypothetical protein
LQEAHWASGFKPRKTPGNDLVDSAEMMVRAFHLWQQTHWPGHSGRVRYANTLFNLYVVRCLTLLILRVWDEESSGTGDLLSQLQSVLNELSRNTPADQPVFVRDVRWLIPVAQSPTTDELAGYFEVAARIAQTLSEQDRSEIHKAGVRMAGGHLRSQLRHISTQKGVSLDDHSLVLSTRRSNALDLALLIQGLASLLEAYERAIQGGDVPKRLELADTICQGISPDPELFVNRIELLGPYSMIEHLFITTDSDGQVVYTPTGQRHLQLLHEYETRIRRLSKPLLEDCQNFKPVEGAYSPYGVLFGFSSNLFEHMALKMIQPGEVTRFSLEDVFEAGDAAKLAWVNGWRKLPHITREMAKRFEYPQQFAEEVFARVEHALHNDAVVQTGRLHIVTEDSNASQIPDLPTHYFRSSDSSDQKDLLHSRLEGEFILSYKTSDGWIAITKDILTEVVGAGHDAKIPLPGEYAAVLKLMCPNLAD